VNPNLAYAIWDRLEFPNENAAGQAGEHDRERSIVIPPGTVGG